MVTHTDGAAPRLTFLLLLALCADAALAHGKFQLLSQLFHHGRVAQLIERLQDTTYVDSATQGFNFGRYMYVPK